MFMDVENVYNITFIDKSKFQNELFNIMQFIICIASGNMHLCIFGRWFFTKMSTIMSRGGVILMSLFFSVLSILQYFYSQNK